MATNCRFAFGVHVMSCLAMEPNDVFSSERLANTVNTNPVVIRRLLLELRDAGLVETQRGPGGGAKLARPANEISLLDIHRATAGEVEPFGEHPNPPAQSCCVGREIKRVLEHVGEQAKAAVEREYASISLQDVTEQLEVHSH